MKEQSIKVVLCEPRKEAVIAEIENSLESLQSIVGGLIELYWIADDIAIVCDDEGKIKNKPLNRCVYNKDNVPIEAIAGTFVILDAGGENFASLSDKDIKRYLNEFQYPEDIFYVGDQILAFEYCEDIPF